MFRWQEIAKRILPYKQTEPQKWEDSLNRLGFMTRRIAEHAFEQLESGVKPQRNERVESDPFQKNLGSYHGVVASAVNEAALGRLEELLTGRSCELWDILVLQGDQSVHDVLRAASEYIASAFLNYVEVNELLVWTIGIRGYAAGFIDIAWEGVPSAHRALLGVCLN